MQSTSSSVTDECEWQVAVSDSPVLLALAYVMPSIFGGIAFLVGALLAWFIITAVLAGAYGRALIFVGGALLAIFGRRWFALALFSGELFTREQEYLSRRGVLLGSSIAAVVLGLSFIIDPRAPVAVFIAGWLPAIFVAAFPTKGTVNQRATTLVIDDDEVPVGAVRNYRLLPIGPFVYCWARYDRGVSNAPRLFIVPRDASDAARNVLDAAADRPHAVESSLSSTERWILVAFGVGLLSIGPVLWVVLPTPGRGFALYAGAMFGLFGVILLWHAATA
ncbi:hypothetical protein U4E84_09845 [Halorubrum sp. AD140]|uniref:hypothetical protein n=1 Tax=Halorubrum sp. AD140 TaxID=3050073 RepID=UPI002ACCB2AF|nr:hypothetical protein [Halorubrum sp. AD140]MDZ5811643.1 hypothetical protein [Halorubrum sp. AD140]